MRQLAPDLRVADMPFRMLGIELGARCTIVRLPTGDLWVHSPIELSPELRRKVDALGPVRWIVGPNTLHYLHLKEWQDAFLNATLCCVKDLKPPLGVTIDQILGETSKPEWSEVLEQTLFRGSFLTTEAVFCHRPSCTLILTDVAFNIPRNRDPLTRLLARALNVLGKLAPSLMFKLSIRDKKAAWHSLNTMLSWDFDRVIVSHGDVCESGGKKALARSYAFLKP